MNVVTLHGFLESLGQLQVNTSTLGDAQALKQMSCAMRMHLAPLWSAATGRSDAKRFDQRRGGAKPRPMRTRGNQVIHVAYTPVKKDH